MDTRAKESSREQLSLKRDALRVAVRQGAELVAGDRATRDKQAAQNKASVIERSSSIGNHSFETDVLCKPALTPVLFRI